MVNKIINIAVIAHVDHGKTTLVDALLKQSHVFRDNQVEMNRDQIMDSNDLERERGITILAKNCSIQYNDYKINIIDTPGHADFSGEVERTLIMADGALLIVDAQEGPMPQTRFVLKKALEMNLKLIVVINKIDKKFAQPQITFNKVESLFIDLAKNEDQLSFPTLYAVGARGVVFDKMPDSPDASGDVTPLIDAIIKEIPPKEVENKTFKMLISNITYDTHLGKLSIGKINSGTVKKGMKVIIPNNPTKYWTVEKLMNYKGISLQEIESAEAPEIVVLSGIEGAQIGDTISDPSDTTELPRVSVGEPTLFITMGPNTSPFGGREGKFFTSRQIEDRLTKECENNLSLKVEKNIAGKFVVAGRGELHLSILLETMRREGYELEVGKPEAIVKDIDGVKSEPLEEAFITVPNEYVGIITEEFGKRAGEMKEMKPYSDTETEFVYHIPTRALIGVRNILVSATKGTVLFNSAHIGYKALGTPLKSFRRGALISSQPGESLAYGLENAQERGVTFIEPGVKVYEGMIIGLNSKDEDIAVNVCKGKKLTNMRSKASDGVIQLTPPTKFSLEQSLDFLNADELLEITPLNLRLRKKSLSELERKREKK